MMVMLVAMVLAMWAMHANAEVLQDNALCICEIPGDNNAVCGLSTATKRFECTCEGDLQPLHVDTCCRKCCPESPPFCDADRTCEKPLVSRSDNGCPCKKCADATIPTTDPIFCKECKETADCVERLPLLGCNNCFHCAETLVKPEPVRCSDEQVKELISKARAGSVNPCDDGARWKVNDACTEVRCFTPEFFHTKTDEATGEIKDTRVAFEACKNVDPLVLDGAVWDACESKEEWERALRYDECLRCRYFFAGLPFKPEDLSNCDLAPPCNGRDVFVGSACPRSCEWNRPRPDQCQSTCQSDRCAFNRINARDKDTAEILCAKEEKHFRVDMVKEEADKLRILDARKLKMNLISRCEYLCSTVGATRGCFTRALSYALSVHNCSIVDNSVICRFFDDSGDGSDSSGRKREAASDAQELLSVALSSDSQGQAGSAVFSETDAEGMPIVEGMGNGAGLLSSGLAVVVMMVVAAVLG